MSVCVEITMRKKERSWNKFIPISPGSRLHDCEILSSKKEIEGREKEGRGKVIYASNQRPAQCQLL